MSNECFERVRLPDYAVPSFVDWTKYYYGSPMDIDAFLSAASEYDKQPCDRASAVILGERSASQAECQYEHMNIYDFQYIFKWDAVEAHHIWLSCNGSFCRCVKARFRNLQYTAENDTPFLRVTCSWGLPGIIRFENVFVFNTLYETEKQFASAEEAEQDMLCFDGGMILGEFFDDILGDG